MTSSKRLKAHLKAAYAYAELSRAKRLKVGAVLLNDDRIISVGYNGMPSGMDNTCEVGDVTRPEVVHAEMNAIAFAAKNGVATKGCTMVTTHSPCFECAKLLVQAGVEEIYYDVEYRLTDSLEFLRSNNVTVERISDAEASRTTTATKGPKEKPTVSTDSD